MSKQQPKQRTLEFFLSKPKQGQADETANKNTGSAPKPKTATNSTSSSTLPSSDSKDAKSLAKQPTSSSSGSNQDQKVRSSLSSRGQDDRDESPLNSFALSSSRSVASDARSRASTASRETPPASEVMDLDGMEEDEEEDIRPTRLKRKHALTVDSDSEDGTNNATKRAHSVKRKSVDLSQFDAGSSDDVNTGKKGKALARPTKRRKTSTADDDFIVPDDEEEEDEPVVLDFNVSDEDLGLSKSKSLKNSKSKSSLRTSDEEDSQPVKSKARAKAPRPSISHNASSNNSGYGMLTAAEQRIQNQKQEKEKEEKPYGFLEDVRDKDNRRPTDEGYDPRSLYIPKEAWKEFTPFETQFWEIKRDHYDTILFFQKGKFYELYEDDARIGHQLFDLKLTSRVKMSMVGVPESSFDFWANKFLARGYKVGKVEQAETSIGAEMRAAAGAGKGKGKELVKRVLNKVFTTGTLMDGEYLIDEEASHCVSIREQGESKFGFAILDSSTSEFKLCSFEDDVCRTRTETLLRQLRPKEVIVSKGNLSVSTNRLLKNVLPGSCAITSLRPVEGFDYQTTLKELSSLYPSPEDDDDGSGAGMPEAIRSMIGEEAPIIALGAMIWYLRTLNIDAALLSAKNFNIYDPMRRGEGLVLDGQTLAHIEVLMNSDGSDDGTLLKLLGRCVTPFGKRLFRIWLCTPLREIKQINDRLDAVEDLMRHDTFEKEFTDLVRGMPDLERIVSRIHAGTCKVKDFLKVLESFKKLNNGLSGLAEKASCFDTQTVAGLLRSAHDLKPYLKAVRGMFVPPSNDNFELIPEDGVDEEYDTIAKEIHDIETDLEQRLARLAKKLDIKLEFWHSATGTKDIYLVQVNAPDKKSVPKDWQKQNDTKAKARFMVPDFAGPIRKLKEARETMKTVVKGFTSRLYAAFDADRDVWLRTVRVTAELDCLLSLAKASAAIGSPSCRPEFVQSDKAFVDFEELRHPGIAMALGAKGGADFIANDVKMGSDGKQRIMLLTGPNMAGKSTLMRQTCVGVIMAQLGMYVPATGAKLSPVDAILTRMGAYDNMFSNSSTFKVELDECCKILREATPKSLVILDELGRGTSTFDGIAIAGAVLHHLATHTLALSFFATHYSTLTNDYAYHQNISMMHMATGFDDENRELIWLYKLVEGVAPSSFGTHVASLAGVPKDVVERADVVSKDFARQFAERLAGRTVGRVPVTAQVDLAYLAKLVDGTVKLSDDPVRKREVLKILKTAAVRYAEPPTA